MKQLKKISAIILVAIVLSVTFHFPVTAATNDFALITANQTPYTQIAEQGDVVTLCVSPSSDYFTESGFDSEEDAEAVDWSLVAGSTSGLSFSEPYANENEDGKYLSCVDVTVANNADPGCASVKATNQNGSYVNMTIIVNKRTFSAYGVNYKVYANGDFSKTPTKEGMFNRVPYNVYTGNTLYPNVADVTKKLENSSVIDNANIYSSPSGTINSYYVGSLTIDDVSYESRTDENGNYYGWQYRVYDLNGNVIPLSEYVGVDDFEVTSGETVVWAYGIYGMVNFPQTIA